VSVWDELIGQRRAVDVMQRAVAGDVHAMSHAWLIVGPPGSGRSNAARAFAAALQCAEGGCGECNSCRTTLSGANPDVTLVRAQGLSIGVDEVRGLARKSAMTPTGGRWQIIVIEEADRVTDQASNALLKSLEEPPPRTVWLLCAPTPDDVSVTIRSRTRELHLVTPNDDDVARLLINRDGVDQQTAKQVAHITQGHVGWARGLARSESARATRQHIITLPSRLTGVGACLQEAAKLVSIAESQVKENVAELDATERANLDASYGIGGGSRPAEIATTYARDKKRLEEEQKSRAKRLVRSELDKVFTDLTTWYRDVLTLQLGATPLPGTAPGVLPAVQIVNVDAADAITAAAQATTTAQTIRYLDAILTARAQLDHNVSPLMAMESLLLSLGSKR
jgi:DNA polymerase-3 subunit delta'